MATMDNVPVLNSMPPPYAVPWTHIARHDDIHWRSLPPHLPTPPYSPHLCLPAHCYANTTYRAHASPTPPPTLLPVTPSTDYPMLTAFPTPSHYPAYTYLTTYL